MAAFPLFSLAMSAAFTAVAWWGGDGFFINVSRGDVVDQDALIAALPSLLPGLAPSSLAGDFFHLGDALGGSARVAALRRLLGRG